MDYVDLHVHSNASDGTCTPAEVVGLAAQADLRAIALTDHDTTAGIPEAMRSISWDFSSRPATLPWKLS